MSTQASLIEAREKSNAHVVYLLLFHAFFFLSATLVPCMIQPLILADTPFHCDVLPSNHVSFDRLAFLGFVRPNVGAIPPMAEMQAMWWALRLQRLVRLAEAIED